LQLGIGLRKCGYEVTILTKNSAEDVRNGRVTSSQLMFGDARRAERESGLNFWDDLCPSYVTTMVKIMDKQGNEETSWCGEFDPAAQSIDQRVKFPRWMEYFEELGGNLLIGNADSTALMMLAHGSELLILATGENVGDTGFKLNTAKSPIPLPMRRTTILYVHGANFATTSSQGALIVVPGAGEIVWMPALTLSGRCHILGVGAVSGGPMDVFTESESSLETLNLTRVVLRNYAPTLSHIWESIDLTDAKGSVSGAITPAVRRPRLRLPSGETALGIGDAVILNDPIAAQGSNNASKAASHYLRCIVECGKGPFSAEWMEATFNSFWQEAKWSVILSNSLLQLNKPKLQQLLHVAESSPFLRRIVLRGYDRPSTLLPWLVNSEPPM
jgi:hypothetical protein